MLKKMRWKMAKRKEVTEEMIDERKLREKLKWLIHPFKNSFNVPENLVNQITEAVKECEITEPEAKSEKSKEEF